jgi:hypothetical protein
MTAPSVAASSLVWRAKYAADALAARVVGATPIFTVGASAFSPFDIIEDLHSGSLSQEDWRRTMEQAALVDHDLAALVTALPPS